MNTDVNHDKTSVLRTIPVPTRVCQTCGVAKSLDHFVSMYTEASTTNCDECRKRQREVYRSRCFNLQLILVKQLKKRKLSISRLRTMTLRSASANSRVDDIDVQPNISYASSYALDPKSPYSSESLSGDVSPTPFSTLEGSINVLCVPSQRWISCFVNDPFESIPVAKVVVQDLDQNKYSLLYHI